MENPTITCGMLSKIPGAAAYNGQLPTNLREATQEFESLFISQMMAAMRSTVQESSLMGSSSGEKMFRQMLDQEYARNISRGSGFGIGEMLYQELSRKMAPDGPEVDDED
jgi:Rod binding domain-containing protein